jgi:MarR family 2-MHQ and catechol resistance regulon transcriptional repressor
VAILFTHLSGAHRGRVDRLPESIDQILIGRGSACDVRVSPADTLVSSRHAQISRLSRGFVVEDIGSRNGTLVNGQMVERAPLTSGDVLQFGPGGPEIRFEIVNDDARARAEHDFTVLLALTEAGDAVDKFIAGYLTDLGLTSTKFNTLQALNQEVESGVTQNQLSSKLTVTGPNITGVLDRLERDNLVARETHPTDRRANLVRLTDEGQTLFEQAADVHALRVRELLSVLSDEEKSEFVRLLKKLSAAAKKNSRSGQLVPDDDV